MKKMIFLMLFLNFIHLNAGHSTEKKNMKAHHSGERFRNPYMKKQDKQFGDFLKFAFKERSRSRVKEFGKQIPTQQINLSKIKSPGLMPQATWIGHSTVLFQYKSKNIITDPVFSDRCSPVSFAGPKRYTKAAASIEELPQIDFAMISHNHYDHLDEASVLAMGNKVKWLVPLGLKEWFSERGINNVVELDWFESTSIDGITFTATPTQHWSRRGINDARKSLWASWLADIDGYKFWFGGDTGYNEIQFKEIGEKLGPIDFAAIPIGAYSPRWFMKGFHVNPKEAVQIHMDIKSKKSMGIHWGTFVLTTEPVIDPPIRLKEALENFGLKEDEFITMAIGETKVLKTEKKLTKVQSEVKP